MTNEELIEALAEAADTAFVDHFEYRIALTRLVDGESIYTLDIPGDVPREFPSHADAADFVRARQRREIVTAILTRLRDLGPSEEMAEAIGQCDIGVWTVDTGGLEIQPGPAEARRIFHAALTSLIGSPK